jgi:hypothetical protein
MAVSPAMIGGSQHGTVEPRVNSPSGSGAESEPVSRAATDDEILGLTTKVRRRDSRGVQTPTETSRAAKELDQLELDFAGEDPRRSEKAPAGERRGSKQKASQKGDDEASNDPVGAANEAATLAGAAEPAHLRAALEANPELRAAWRDAKAYRETFATPEEARTATGMLADLNRMDALFFSRHPEDHAQLARAVAELDPVAFASLARAMTQVARTATAAFPAIAARSAASRHPAEEQPSAADLRNATPAPATGSAAAQQALASATPGVTPAQEQFFHSTNAAAVEGVVEAIEAQVERLLPEGISKSARNRVVGEIYRELDSTLRANRTLTQQMRDAFRSGGLDTNHQKAIVSLITGRARQALPGVAKRVLNEWTTTVVSANQERRTRQHTAERRVDIGGAGGAGNEGRHSMGPREINYARMSDADILNL